MTRYQRRRSRIERRRFMQAAIAHGVIILAMMVVSIMLVVNAWVKDESGKNNDYHLDAGNTSVEFESPIQAEPTQKPVESVKPIVESQFPVFTYSKDWDGEDSYLLAKIAMAEAEGCDTHTKELVILTVLNRVHSDSFPDTISDVIYQKLNGVPQFSPTVSNRWELEPSEDCWLAVENVMMAEYDFSQGCLYFESCEDEDNWHNRNLEFLFESGGIRFYK